MHCVRVPHCAHLFVGGLVCYSRHQPTAGPRPCNERVAKFRRRNNEPWPKSLRGVNSESSSSTGRPPAPARVVYQCIAPVQEGAAAAEAAVASVWVAPIGRDRARRFLVAIQVGYLALYAATLIRVEIAAEVLGARLLRRVGWEDWAATLLVALALTGVAVRLYLITTVSLDHPQTGRQYRRLFPALFVFDELWALAPLLWTGATGLVVALVLIPVLAYAPLSQRTLIRSAYPGRGGAAEGP